MVHFVRRGFNKYPKNRDRWRGYATAKQSKRSRYKNKSINLRIAFRKRYNPAKFSRWKNKHFA